MSKVDIPETKYLGANVSVQFFRAVKMQAALRDLNMREAIIKGLCMVLGIDEEGNIVGEEDQK